MKKNNVVISILLAIFTAPTMVAAQSLPAPPDLGRGAVSFFNALLSNQSYYQLDAEVISRILIFTLLFVIIYISAKRIFTDTNNKKIPVVIALIVAAMSVRYLTPEMIRGLFLPYESLGIVLSIIIPFALFEGFILTGGRDFPKPLRNIGYYLLIGIFLSMWLLRSSEIGDLSFYYLIASIIGVLAFSFDESLHQWMIVNNLRKSKDRGIYLNLMSLEEKMEEAAEDLAKASVRQDEAAKKASRDTLAAVREAISELSKQLGK